MPRLLVSTRRRVIILERQGYALKEIRKGLEEESTVPELLGYFLVLLGQTPATSSCRRLSRGISHVLIARALADSNIGVEDKCICENGGLRFKFHYYNNAGV